LDSILQDKEVPKSNDIRDITYYKGSSYIALSAKAKQAQMWEEIEATKSSTAQWPGAKMGGIFLEDMDPSFTEGGDTMPHSETKGTRPKYLHSVGVIGKAMFTSAMYHPYTGIFRGA
jgi:hypothetical protein